MVADMGSNESALGPSPNALAAMFDAARGLSRYPPLYDAEFRETLARTISHDLGPEHFVIGNGACDVLSMIARAYLTADTECIICRPTFPVYEQTARLQGASVNYVDLDPETFCYDIDSVIGSVTERTRLIYVGSPNNPTGTLLPADNMHALVKNVPPKVTIVADEVYHHFVSGEVCNDSLSHVKAGENVIVVHSFSKAFGLAGARLGYGIAAPGIIQQLARFRLPYHINNVSYQGGLAALRDSTHLKKSIQMVGDGRTWMHEALTGAGVRVWPSEANFLLFQTEYAAVDVAKSLEQRGVIVRSMEEFYLPNHLRVTVGLPHENQYFIAALSAVLEEMAA